MGTTSASPRFRIRSLSRSLRERVGVRVPFLRKALTPALSLEGRGSKSGELPPPILPPHSHLAKCYLPYVNWLAHVFLSEPHVEARLGNLLADIVKGADRERMSAEFLRGIQRHQAIDSFTDAHPVVRRSRARVGSGQKRFSGILVDVFYDYFLARNWELYASIPLDTFTAGFYADIKAARIALPPAAQATVDRMIRRDMLGEYRQIHAVEH